MPIPSSELRTLHAIGDSHSGLFMLQPIWPEVGPQPLPGLRSVRLGPYLAHSVATPGHPVRELLARSLAESAPGDRALVAFGEIDCRYHVVFQAERQKRPIESVATELGERYTNAVADFVRLERVGILAAPPQVDTFVVCPTDPTVTFGTFEERRLGTAAFNASTGAACARRGLAFVDYSAKLAQENGHQRRELFMDQIHVGRRALPIIADSIVEAELLDPRLVDAFRASARAVFVLGEPSEAPVGPVFHQVLPRMLPEYLVTNLVDRAALACVASGAKRIGIYGAGKHTRRIGLEIYRNRGLRVAAVLDDAPTQPSLLGVPVMRPEEAIGLVDAVVISSDSVESCLAERAEIQFGPAGVPVVMIYGLKAVSPIATGAAL